MTTMWAVHAEGNDGVIDTSFCNIMPTAVYTTKQGAIAAAVTLAAEVAADYEAWQEGDEEILASRVEVNDEIWRIANDAVNSWARITIREIPVQP